MFLSFNRTQPARPFDVLASGLVTVLSAESSSGHPSSLRARQEEDSFVGKIENETDEEVVPSSNFGAATAAGHNA